MRQRQVPPPLLAARKPQPARGGGPRAAAHPPWGRWTCPPLTNHTPTPTHLHTHTHTQTTRPPEGHHLRLLQREPLVEEAGEVYVHHVPAAAVHQDVLAVPVAQTHHVTHHAPHGCRLGREAAKLAG